MCRKIWTINTSVKNYMKPDEIDNTHNWKECLIKYGILLNCFCTHDMGMHLWKVHRQHKQRQKQSDVRGMRSKRERERGREQIWWIRSSLVLTLQYDGITADTALSIPCCEWLIHEFTTTSLSAIQLQTASKCIYSNSKWTFLAYCFCARRQYCCL